MFRQKMYTSINNPNLSVIKEENAKEQDLILQPDPQYEELMRKFT